MSIFIQYIYATFSFFLIIKTPTALKANAINITWVGEIGSPVWGNLSFLFSEFSPSLGNTSGFTSGFISGLTSGFVSGFISGFSSGLTSGFVSG